MFKEQPHDAEEFRGMALWYAWGRMDSGEYRGKDLALDAFEFAALVKASRIAFAKGETNFFESIQGQWAKYVESKGTQ